MNHTDLELRLFSLIRGEPDVDFDSLALQVHAYQRKTNTVYYNYCEQFAAPTNWKAIPAIPLDAFKTHEITCFDPRVAKAIFHTSGTTGRGTGRHFFYSLEIYHEASCRGWELANLPRTELFALLLSPEEAPHSSLSRMAGWLIPERSRFFIRQDGPLWSQLEQRIVQETKPICLFGTALAFLDWFEQIGDRFLPLPRGSIAVETGGYKGSKRMLSKAELYQLFEQKLRLNTDCIVNEYGMTELSSQFYARGTNGVHCGPPWARAVVINPSTGMEAEDGAVGVLKIIDLANLYSCIALQTSDLAVRRGERFQLIGRDPQALPRGCSLAADELLGSVPMQQSNGE